MLVEIQDKVVSTQIFERKFVCDLNACKGACCIHGDAGAPLTMEEVTEEFTFGDFGRRNILSLRQNLISRIMELEKDNLYKVYKEKIGEIVTGEVYQVWKKEIMVIDDEGNELLLPKSECPLQSTKEPLSKDQIPLTKNFILSPFDK